MNKIKVYDLQKNEVGELDIADKIYNAAFSAELISNAVVAYRAEKRQGTRATKTTSTVNGSTRKLFRQKGTGRARAGSSKAVQRRHGATQFGPQPRDFSIKINKKEKKMAILGAFSDALRQEKCVVIDELKLPEIKAKNFKDLLLKWQTPSLLIIESFLIEDNFYKSARNFNNIKLNTLRGLNIVDLLKYSKIWISKEAASEFLKRYDYE